MSAEDYNPAATENTSVDASTRDAKGALRLEVRDARAEDADALATLSQELLAFYGLPKPYQKSYMSHAIAKHAMAPDSGLHILVCDDGRGQLIGFLAYARIYALANCRSSFFIQDIFISRKARAKGAGRALMQALIDRADAAGIGQIDWTADLWNEAAARFYDSFGPMLTTDKRFHRLTQDRFNNNIKK